MTPLALGLPPTTNRYEFADWLEDAASDRYLSDHPGSRIREFEFKSASYLFDDRPGIDRTILAMSPPTSPGVARDTYVQRAYPMNDSAAGRPLDRGHFIPHSAGGDFGPNLFPQDRALNRGWSPDGRAYRAMERAAIAAGANALLFIRPVYIDDTSTPAFIELGYWAEGAVTATVFRNRFDEMALRNADRFRAEVGGATNARAGSLGEETVRVLLEERGEIIVGAGDASMERDGSRQALDLLVLVDGDVVAYEVKTRHMGPMAGLRTRVGNLRRPRLRATGARPRQGSEEYVDVRADRIIDAGPDSGHPGVGLILVDFVAMLAQEFSITVSGRVGAPISPPMDCEPAAREAYEHIIGHRGHL